MKLFLLPVLVVGLVGAEESPPSKDISKTLEDGTVQGFSLQLTDERAFSSFSIFQKPGSEESVATGAILYAIPAETGVPKTMHLRISQPAVVGEESTWDFSDQILDAIKEDRFPNWISDETTLTLHFLRGVDGLSVGTPITMGSAPESTKSPSRGESGCRAGDCFSDRFAVCKDASLEAKATIDLSYRYDILGPGENGCRVRSTFLLHPKESWSGKSMVCVYDDSIPFKESILKPLSCTGKLAEAMRQ